MKLQLIIFTILIFLISTSPAITLDEIQTGCTLSHCQIIYQNNTYNSSLVCTNSKIGE